MHTSSLSIPAVSDNITDEYPASSSVFPGDLLIGRVDSVERSNADSSYYAILTPYVDVTEVTDVFVVTDFDGKGDVATGLPETNNKDEEDPAQTASKGNE